MTTKHSPVRPSTLPPNVTDIGAWRTEHHPKSVDELLAEGREALVEARAAVRAQRLSEEVWGLIERHAPEII